MSGEVKLFDMANSAGTVQTDATLAESNYTRVTSLEHKFVGIPLIDNGIIRVAAWNPTKTGDVGDVPFYCFTAAGWAQYNSTTTKFLVESSATGLYVRTSIIENTAQRVRLLVEKHFTVPNKVVCWTVTVRRGYPTALFETSDAGWSHIHTGTATGNFYYSANATVKDGADPADTKTETWSMTLLKGIGAVVPVISSKQKTKGYYGGLLRFDTSNDLKWVSVAMLNISNSDQGGADGGVWHKECENQGALSGDAGTWTAIADAAASAGDMLSNGTGAAGDRKNFAMYAPWKGYYRLAIQARHESVTTGHQLEVYVNDGTDVLIDTLNFHTASTAYELKMTRPFMLGSVAPIIGLKNKTGNTTNPWKLDQIVLIPIGRTKDSPSESIWPAEVAHEPLAGVELVASDIVN